MTCLIHLNGPPGIGKSTLSALYTHRHPGTLNLDIDSLHRLVGGWKDPDNHAHQILRPVALAMAATHLQGGRDVILPQYLARVDAIQAFADVAAGNGAEFREFILLDTKEESIARFERRPDYTSWDEYNRAYVALLGGSVMLARMYDELLEVSRLRPSAVIISEMGTTEETYAELLRALR